MMRHFPIPHSTGTKKVFHRFTNGATSSGKVGDEASDFPNFRNRIVHRHRISASFEHGQVGEVVTDHRGLVRLDAEIHQDGVENGSFAADAGADDLDSQFIRSSLHRPAASTGDDGDSAARPLPCSQTDSVPDEKTLGFVSLIVEEDGTIGEHAVDVEAEQADSGCGLEVI
jgi:hypothetical protein